MVSWLKDPDSVEQGVEDAITKAISYRSGNGETTFHDAEMDFSPSQWKEIMEIHSEIPTLTPQFEQMHPYQDSHRLLTPDRSGPLSQTPVHSERSTGKLRTPTASGANSPQHPGMWNNTSPRHRKNLPPLEMPSPSPPKRFGWMTPTRRRRQAPDPVSPDFSKAPLSPAKSSRKWQPPAGSVSPARSTVGKVDRFEGKSPAKAWKNLSRSISPLFGGRKQSDHGVSSTLKSISRDIGQSFQGSRRRGPSSVARTPAAVNGNVPNWSGDSSMVAPDLEKETLGEANFHVAFRAFDQFLCATLIPETVAASEIGYSSELTRNGSMRSTKSGAGNSHNSVFNILGGWGKKKASNGTKVNELFQVVDQGSIKLDSNSFKVMEYTIKTLHFKLEQAKKNELATAEEFKSLQSAMDAAEGKCQQWQQRCQDLESQLGVRQTESKDIELDYEIAKHKRESNNAAAATIPRRTGLQPWTSPRRCSRKLTKIPSSASNGSPPLSVSTFATPVNQPRKSSLRFSCNKKTPRRNCSLTCPGTLSFSTSNPFSILFCTSPSRISPLNRTAPLLSTIQTSCGNPAAVNFTSSKNKTGPPSNALSTSTIRRFATFYNS